MYFLMGGRSGDTTRKKPSTATPNQFGEMEVINYGWPEKSKRVYKKGLKPMG